MEAFGAVSSTLGGLTAAYRMAEIGFRYAGVREDAQAFVRLVQIATADLKHASKCFADLKEVLENNYPEHLVRWNLDTIRRTHDVLEDFGNFLVDPSGKLNVDARIKYLLSNYNKLVDRERTVKLAHTSLTATINFMNVIYVQQSVNLSQRPLALSAGSTSQNPDSSLSQGNSTRE